MSRGRKGPPQESIDSILQMIGRRNIDANTMAHYFERLDEEWVGGAREKILHLLRTSDPAAHAAAVLVLSELATEFDLEELEDFVADPTVSDMAKLALSPILKNLGSEMADEGIVEYLNDPLAAIQQMQARLLDLVGQSEIGIESILEDVVSMPLERRLAFINWLGGSNDPRAASLLVPLLENQAGKVGSTIIDAFEQLGPIAVKQTVPALQHMVATSSKRELKEHAREVMNRLMIQSLLQADEMKNLWGGVSALPLFEARTSFIDGSGSQLIMISWLRANDTLKGINILCQDQWGIKECYGIDEMERAHWQRLIKELDEQGFNSFEISFSYSQKLVMEARALNKRMRHKLPIAYSVWRPYLEANMPVKKGRQTETTALELPQLDAQTRALAQRGEELYEMPEFASWLYEPYTSIEPYMTRYWAQGNSFDPPMLEKRTTRRKRKQLTKEKQTLLDELVDEALQALINDKWRTLYMARLCRQAALLRLRKREQHAELVCAVAALLSPDAQVPAQEQPFLRAMVRLSIEQGPLRMMVEALGEGDLGAISLDLFHQK